MNDSIREQLIGYVLGALDESEQRLVEERLGQDAAWRQELEAVQKMLEPLAEGACEEEPPAQLTERTCRFVAEESERLRVERPRRVRISGGGAAGGENAGRWRMADWIMISGVGLVAVLLLFPALLNSRFTARLMACQNNLRELGIALAHVSEMTRDRFLPPIPLEGNGAFAGIYAPKLQEAGLLADARLVICPESGQLRPLANFRIPTLAEIEAATGEQVALLQKSAGGTYAYPLGFVEDGRHVPPRNLGRTHFVLMADAPSLDVGRFAVHGHGLNVLFEDCHVQLLCNWEKSCTTLVDNPFCNRLGVLDAGTDIEDSVVAPSYHPPRLRNAVYSR